MKSALLAICFLIVTNATSKQCFATFLTIVSAENFLFAQAFANDSDSFSDSSDGNTSINGFEVLSFPSSPAYASVFYSASNSYSISNSSATLATDLYLDSSAFSGDDFMSNGNTLYSKIRFDLTSKASANLMVVSALGYSPSPTDYGSLLAELRNVNTNELCLSTWTYNDYFFQNIDIPPPMPLILNPGTYELQSYAFFGRNGQVMVSNVSGNSQTALSLVPVPEPASIIIWSGLGLCGWFGRRRLKLQIA